MSKIPISQIVLVEGKYDKIMLENLLDATIIPCDGFGIYRKLPKRNALQSMARERGAIILTDSDSAGLKIRSFLHTLLQGAALYDLYIPAVVGKEKRKQAGSKEGLLGVEGMQATLLKQLFVEFRAVPVSNEITAADLMVHGLSGCTGAQKKKEDLLARLRLPPHLSNKSLLKELNRRFTLQELDAYLRKK